MTLTRFSPMTDFVSLREAMNHLVEDSFIRPGMWNGVGALSVPVDIWESKDSYHLRADLPGLTVDDIDINATADTVQITGEVKALLDVTTDGWLRQERRVGKFQRAFTLPLQIDSNKVAATFANGVLELTLPKADSVKPRSIKAVAK